LIALFVNYSISMRTAAWVSVPVFFALNGYVLWRAVSSRQRWVIACCAERIYVRLFALRGKDRGDINEPDVIVLEPSEIASMSARTVEVFLYGPKPRIVEWLVIEPAQAVAEEISDHVRPLLRQLDPGRAVLVTDDEGSVTIEWKWWRPALRVFLQEIVRECPSVVISHEERSELDLNGIWNGVWRKPDAQQRQMLVQAKRFGFGCECAGLLSRHRSMSFQKAMAYLAEIERDETGTGNDSETRDSVAMQNPHL
jgi:hypothetical protein